MTASMSRRLPATVWLPPATGKRNTVRLLGYYPARDRSVGRFGKIVPERALRQRVIDLPKKAGAGSCMATRDTDIIPDAKVIAYPY